MSTAAAAAAFSSVSFFLCKITSYYVYLLLLLISYTTGASTQLLSLRLHSCDDVAGVVLVLSFRLFILEIVRLLICTHTHSHSLLMCSLSCTSYLLLLCFIFGMNGKLVYSFCFYCDYLLAMCAGACGAVILALLIVVAIVMWNANGKSRVVW